MYKNSVIIISFPLLALGFIANFIWNGLWLGWEFFNYCWECSE